MDAINIKISTALNGPEIAKPLKKMRKAKHVRTADTVEAELRALVLQHAAYESNCRRVNLMGKPSRKIKGVGVVKSRLDTDVLAQYADFLKVLEEKKTNVERAMTSVLKEHPIYRDFLKDVFGLGPIFCAYFLAYVDFRLATKPSKLRMYCGSAVSDGQLIRRKAGAANTFNSRLRVKLYSAMCSLMKNITKSEGTTTKYYKVWTDFAFRATNDPRYDAETNTFDDRKFASTHIRKKGMWKAADVLLEDLYILGRAQLGLEIWPSYYAQKLTPGFGHNGVKVDLSPRTMTYEEALALVSDGKGKIEDGLGVRLSDILPTRGADEEEDEDEDDLDMAA